MSTEEVAAELLRNVPDGARVVVIYHGDADGVCGGVIAVKTLRHLGKYAVTAEPLKRGENPFSPSVHDWLAPMRPHTIVVIDSGSRVGRFPAGSTAIIIDHHVPIDTPDVELFFNTYLDGTQRTASLASYDIARLVDASLAKELEWVALAGTVGDLGTAKLPHGLNSAVRRHGSQAIRDCVSLINAARRHRDYKVEQAFEIVLAAGSPREFITLAEEGGLRHIQVEVKEEVRRALRTAPRFSGRYALLLFSSAHQVHPVVAVAWARRLPHNIVIAANVGFLPGMVNFSTRTEMDVDLMRVMGSYRLKGEELGFGHEKATGGIVSEASFSRIMKELGFEEIDGLLRIA